MAGSFRIRSLQFPFGNLHKIGFVWVVVIRLQVAEHRGLGIRSVIGKDDSLRIPQFHESLHVEPKVGLGAVAFGRGDICPLRKSFTSEQSYTGVMSALGQGVADLEPVISSA